MSEIIGLIENYKNSRNQLVENSKANLEEEVRKILSRPEYANFQYCYKGYTPSFNDGDVCSFNFYEDYDEDHPDDPDDLDWRETKRAPSELSNLINSIPDDIISDIYGEYGFRLIMTCKGIRVEDYDCGY